MSDFRQSGERPMRPQDHLGPEVKIERQDLENDQWAQTTLKDIGKTMKQAQHVYMGSVAVHFYRTQENVLTGEHELALKNQLALADITEAVASMALANLAVEMKRHYGRSHKTTDTKDKR